MRPICPHIPFCGGSEPAPVVIAGRFLGRRCDRRAAYRRSSTRARFDRSPAFAASGPSVSAMSAFSPCMLNGMERRRCYDRNVKVVLTGTARPTIQMSLPRTPGLRLAGGTLSTLKGESNGHRSIPVLYFRMRQLCNRLRPLRVRVPCWRSRDRNGRMHPARSRLRRTLSRCIIGDGASKPTGKGNLRAMRDRVRCLRDRV